MTAANLPEPMDCPISWKYSTDWEEEFNGRYGKDSLNKICRHTDAGKKITWYITHYGEMALTKVKTQNLAIKRLVTNEPTAEAVQAAQRNLYGGHLWEDLVYFGEELVEVYNANLAPSEVIEILTEVQAFMREGQRHGMALSSYLKEMNDNYILENSVRRNLQGTSRLRGQRKVDWDAVDHKHSAATAGFIYLLSNELMPGVYKIGFTAKNPDKRASEISATYGLPLPFKLVKYWRTKDPYIVEQRIHAAIGSYARPGEFFELDIQVAYDHIEAALIVEGTGF